MLQVVVVVVAAVSQSVSQPASQPVTQPLPTMLILIRHGGGRAEGKCIMLRETDRGADFSQNFVNVLEISQNCVQFVFIACPHVPVAGSPSRVCL